MPAEKHVDPHQERAKVDCLYRIWEALDRPDTHLEDALETVVTAIPSAVQHPQRCRVRVTGGGAMRQSPDFRETPWSYRTDITVRGRAVGSIEVCYDRADSTVTPPFDAEEQLLFETVASRLASFIEMQELRERDAAAARPETAFKPVDDWRALMGLLIGTNLELVFRLSHKMFIHLRLRGVDEADELIEMLARPPSPDEEDTADYLTPIQRTREETVSFCEAVFHLAGLHLSDEEIFGCLQRWMHEEKYGYFVRTISNPESTLRQTIDAIRFLGHIEEEGVELSDARLKATQVHLIQRFLSERMEFIKVAKDYLTKEDFYELIRRMVYLQSSHGKLGAKGARLFLASHILQKEGERHPELKKVKTPKTWFVTTDCLFAFLCYNDLEDMMDQKYKKLDQIREEFPLVMRFFRHAQFPPEIVRGLAMALDDFGEVPLIVRSTSLLEDQLGAEFSGKYVSRFVANRGRKADRLKSLLDAISEVWASVFSADPISFRAQRGLIDFEEDVGVMIQEVVGIPVGQYYLSPFAGWALGGGSAADSPYEAALKLIFGLGTRAKEDENDTVHFSLEPPVASLRDESSHAPQRMDVITLETGRVETLDIREFMKTYGRRLVGIEHVISSVRDGQIAAFSPVGFDYDRDPWMVTFEGLVRHTPFATQVRTLLDVLTSAFRTPLELEFASNGHDLYLLDSRRPKSSPALGPR
jgi:pyruvate,water dikinase